ncbi:hypothetical protein VY88_20185 [Azospirillum thiophilum]|uniref:PRISE-like Rossmann-fold domain-containing protein n=1 Tax=Azospirillum thiophilum TaxID=528244 RepID=A0AAC8W3D6_9PROT|nr:SDR family oxidoreductase [Azospirillum thiophilum]ALG74355.1 hypothetical protein AL072_25785 [Azospirillum thiophilum]KJR63777.1 hypothetical protein VY88_20185 [Azospirillum thiophilum]
MGGTRKALIVGATGIVGGAVLDHLVSAEDWDVVAASRKPPLRDTGAAWLPLDLLDPADCRRAIAGQRDVTHVFYTAYAKAPTPAAEVAVNLPMLTNLMDALDSEAAGLRHVQLVHGQKWYGSHLGPYRTPAREDDPRHIPPNFYYDQQDALAARQRGREWTWSAVRPQAPLTFSLGSPMNQLLVVALYGSMCRELGLPLDFPGKPGCFEALYQVTDPGLLARAMEHVAVTPRCANQAFNVTNGDLFRWANLWPRLAGFFGVPQGRVRPLSLARIMADKSSLWQRMTRVHTLAPHAMETLVDWAWGDFVFGSDYDNVSSLLRLRDSGFHECIDSEQLYLQKLQELRDNRIIP